MGGETAKTTEGDSQIAKSTIAALLNHLHVKRVVFIDDSFELTQSPESAIGWFEQALERSPEEAGGLLPEVNFGVPERGWAEEFRTVWMQLGGERRGEIVTSLSAILDSYIGQDLDSAVDLKALFPRRLRPLELGPTAWVEQRHAILGDASPENRVLCFFDQDLSKAVGFTAQGTRSGIGLLSEVVNGYPEDAVICGLLSHLFSREREMTEWRRFAAENNLDLARFLPISKDRLKEPLSFAAAVKKTTLNLYCERMKSDVIEVMRSAGEEAENDLRQIDVYDFDHIVFQSPLKEGVSELETLLRIFQIFHQDHVKRAFLTPDSAEQFNGMIEQARPLSRIGDSLRDNRPDQRWELRHQEMFEQGALVNAFHSPLQTGDLFCLDGEDQPTLILVAQPCDLMVRSNGTRGEHGEDKAADLIPLRPISREEYDTGAVNFAVRGTLPYLYKGTNDIGAAEFARAHTVRLDVLDLAVLDPEGHCQIDLSAVAANPPPQFHLAWRARRDRLVELFRDRAATLERLIAVVQTVEEQETRAELVAAIMPTVTLSRLPLTVPSFHDGRFDFGIRRVGRFREPWAVRLLASYMRYRSREADQHDFSI